MILETKKTVCYNDLGNIVVRDFRFLIKSDFPKFSCLELGMPNYDSES